MNTLREAAQQALDALDRAPLFAGRREAADALRAALAEPEQQKATEAYWLIDHTGRYYQNPKHPLNSQRTEPEQEPYTDDITQAIRESGMTFHLGIPHAEVIEQLSRFADAIKAEATIKAASMAASVISETQRQPLTDERLLEILVSVDAETKRLPPGFKAFARAVERAHGIGGAA